MGGHLERNFLGFGERPLGLLVVKARPRSSPKPLGCSSLVEGQRSPCLLLDSSRCPSSSWSAGKHAFWGYFVFGVRVLGSWGLAIRTASHHSSRGLPKVRTAQAAGLDQPNSPEAGAFASRQGTRESW